MQRLVIISFLVLSALKAFSTAQETECIYDNGVSKGLCSLLLELDSITFSKLESRIPQKLSATCLWRNYIGYWKIKNDSLFLDSVLISNPIHGEKDFIPVRIDDIYAGKRTESGYFADWVSGPLRFVSGEIVHYVHDAWESAWEHEERVTVENGIVKGRVPIENRILHKAASGAEMMKMRADLDVGELPAPILLKMGYSAYDSDGNPVSCDVTVIRSCGDEAIDARVIKVAEEWLLTSRPLPIYYINGSYKSDKYIFKFPVRKKQS